MSGIETLSVAATLPLPLLFLFLRYSAKFSNSQSRISIVKTCTHVYVREMKGGIGRKISANVKERSQIYLFLVLSTLTSQEKIPALDRGGIFPLLCHRRRSKTTNIPLKEVRHQAVSHKKVKLYPPKSRCLVVRPRFLLRKRTYFSIFHIDSKHQTY